MGLQWRAGRYSVRWRGADGRIQSRISVRASRSATVVVAGLADADESGVERAQEVDPTHDGSFTLIT